ncbi:MAG: hypothetical protein AVDCRST_MAG50-1669 [uncultured Acidimicrobiales bacterium]|uniref:diacylglycerol O-acyltransferase n=1 Tax=uncultured Acidimicrobiales bacterium TaxID=310071 RepID=A0A6J4HNP6_9ACTN|nr:MAG: hypothetical protein AVDCRST_MAG50-1669 [uncultured Acidimicrobiales bacterium]
MTEAESLLWRLDADPRLRSSFVTISFLEAPPDFDRFRRRMAAAVIAAPRLQQRPASGAPWMVRPVWQRDPAFDLDFHLRRLHLPAPGSDHQLLEWAAGQHSEPMDTTRALWQYTVVEGLERNRAALVTRMHHALTDGLGGVRLSALFMDASPSPTEALPLDTEHLVVTDDEDETAAPVRALGEVLGGPLRFGRRVAGAAVSTALAPQRVPAAAGDATEMGRSLLRQLVITDRARSPLWRGRRSTARRFVVTSIDLERLRSAAHALGGTINDAYVCILAGAAGTYHRERGAPVDELRMSMPVSTRTDRYAGGNAFAPTRVLVPTGVATPPDRFAEIVRRLATTKAERSLGLLDPLAGLLHVLPPPVLTALARSQADTVDFAASNVRGAPFDLYVAGARVERNHPMGPTAGTAFNATVMSYNGRLDLGLNVDLAAVDDPEALLRHVDEAAAELVAFA